MCSLYKEYFKNRVVAPYCLLVINLKKKKKDVLIVGLNPDITSQGQGTELN